MKKLLGRSREEGEDDEEEQAEEEGGKDVKNVQGEGLGGAGYKAGMVYQPRSSMRLRQVTPGRLEVQNIP